MKILNYIRAIANMFSKDTLRDDIRNTINELNQSTIPAYNTTMTILKTWTFKSPEMKQQIAAWNGLTDFKGNNIIVSIHTGLVAAEDNLRFIEKYVETNFGEDIIAAGLTFPKAQVLQFVDACSFASKYARKFLNYVIVCETAQFPDAAIIVGEEITKAELAWLLDNFQNFILALNAAGTNPNQLPKLIADMPDVVVSEDSEQVSRAIGGDKKTDPLKMGLIPIVLNPLYHYGMAKAEWQAKRHKAAQEELKLLQLRKLALEKLSNGKPDLGLKRQIDYMAGRIQNLNYEIAKLENP